jgi:hypothetical protein
VLISATEPVNVATDLPVTAATVPLAVVFMTPFDAVNSTVSVLLFASATEMVLISALVPLCWGLY